MQARTGQRRKALLDGVEYDAETKDTAEPSEAAAAATSAAAKAKQLSYHDQGPIESLVPQAWEVELAHTSSLDTDLTRNTRAPHFTPQHWLLCHMGLY